jgi:hypothetical protein
MGGPGSGRKPFDVCGAGLHDMTDPDNVNLVKRGNKTERQCRQCQNKRQRDRWRAKHGIEVEVQVKKDEWPKDGEHLWGPWYVERGRVGKHPAKQYRQCVHPLCKEVQRRDAPSA